MNLAVVSSLALLLGVLYIPFLRPIFKTTFLGWEQWQVILPLLFVPALAAEATKYFLAWRRKQKN